MQLADLKQIETGHYILYHVNFTRRVAFRDLELAKEVMEVLQSYNDQFWEDGPGYTIFSMQKEIAVFDGTHFHLSRGDVYDMEALSGYDSWRRLSKSGPHFLETEFARRILRGFGCPVLRRRGWFMHRFCCYTLLCCCFGRAIKV